MRELSSLLDDAWSQCDALQLAFHDGMPDTEIAVRARYMEATVQPLMAELRRLCDGMEEIVDASRWPIPTYTDLLHRV